MNICTSYTPHITYTCVYTHRHREREGERILYCMMLVWGQFMEPTRPP